MFLAVAIFLVILAVSFAPLWVPVIIALIVARHEGDDGTTDSDDSGQGYAVWLYDDDDSEI